jgi:hypothetical protein
MPFAIGSEAAMSRAEFRRCAPASVTGRGKTYSVVSISELQDEVCLAHPEMNL